ncbi:BglII/BstYI family type II restriction endonuclease [Methylocystis sp.]|uniref:BglII/BstYI family type II restriction endonuclease n=1 Tax=Methylocystis sp. TaxID=1911079 RepID=UPI00273764BB|nr:BglII/BstYI family type II restriction endonuclease [Methylocystis sp.]MDP3552631.1 BglII/BstYI family type II restriction endonuclease [Methylocystis sp.]
MFENLKSKGFQVEFHSHASAILSVDFPEALRELESVLASVTIPIEEIIGSGGGETKGTQRLRRALAAANWTKVNFIIEKTINGVQRESKSHEVDHVRTFPSGDVIALEIEWNNKDPFFDRDLENFKRLHAEGAISVGVIVTRGASLQESLFELVRRYAEQQHLSDVADLARISLNPTPRQKKTVESRVARGVPFPEAWASAFVQDKYGAATTHWRKLEDRVRRGVGNPCPLLLIGLPASIVTFDEPAEVVEALIEEGGAEPSNQA